jgi:hypothetical protein
MPEPTERQLVILAAYIEAGTYPRAAHRLQVPVYVIRDELAALRAVMRARSSAQAFGMAVRDGLIDPHGLRIDEAA